MHEYGCGCGRFILGMTTGLVAGAAVGMTLSPSRREVRRMANKAAKHVTQAVENLTDAMGI